MTEILYGHGYKAKSEPKQPVDEKKIVDLGFEDAFIRGNLDTSYSLQSEIYNTPGFRLIQHSQRRIQVFLIVQNLVPA